MSQLLLDFTVVVDAALLRVNEKNLSRLQTTFLCHLSRVDIHHSHLTGYYHHAILRDGIACRTQTVAVEHTTGKAPVGEEQCRRTVPRLHQYGVVLIERLQVF